MHEVHAAIEPARVDEFEAYLSFVAREVRRAAADEHRANPYPVFVDEVERRRLVSEVGATDPDIERAQALSPERHLKLIEIAKAASRLGSEREFRAGLDIVMAGLTAS